MNQKGSILLSLLSGILLLGIILFFVLRDDDKISEADKQDAIDFGLRSASITSVYAYISSVEAAIAEQFIYGNDFASGKYSNLDIENMFTLCNRGIAPSDGIMCISSRGIVVKGSFSLNGYILSYDGKDAEVIGATQIEDINCLE